MSQARVCAIAPCLLGGILYWTPFPFESPSLPPSEAHEVAAAPSLFARYPALRQVEKDLASGWLRLNDAVAMVEPLVEHEAHICNALAPQSKGLSGRVAWMLCQWVEKAAFDDPESVSDATLERLYDEFAVIRETEHR